MAHGALYLFGAYIGLLIGSEQNWGGILGRFAPFGLEWGFLAALILTPIVVFVIGVAMERLMAKPFYERSMLDQLLVTFGILIILQEVVAVLLGRAGRTYARPDWAAGGMAFPGIGSAPRWRIYVFILTGVLVLLLFAFYKYTDYGLAVRAGTEDSEMTQLLGIRIGRPFLLIFAIGAAFAGMAGLLGGSLFTVQPEMGIDIIIPALVIVIMGGVGSIRGTVVAALLAGLAFTSVTSVWPAMAQASIYILAIIVLLIRPSGIFPTAEIE